MPSRWIDFIKSWAAEHKITYGCALSDVDMRAAYHKKYPKTTLTKADKQTLKPLESEIKRFASLDQKNKKKVDDESHKFAELYGKVDKLYDEQQALTKKNGFVGAMATRVMGLRSSLNLIGTKFDYFDGEEPEPAPAAAAPAPAPAAAKAASPPKAKAPAKELNIIDRTSALPADLQGLIFSKLPQQKQRDVLEGTEEERGRRDLINWLKTHPVKANIDWLYDWNEFDRDEGYYEYERTLIDDIYQNSSGYSNSSSWSEDKANRMMEKAHKTADKEAKKDTFDLIKLYKKGKLSDYQIVNQLRDELWRVRTFETKAEKKARETAVEKLKGESKA